MKVITHRYRESNKYKTSYLINLVDYNGRPLESHVAKEIEINRQQLKKAHEASKDEEIIDLVDELNVLWQKANVIMKENMKKDNREPLQ